MRIISDSLTRFHVTVDHEFDPVTIQGDYARVGDDGILRIWENVVEGTKTTSALVACFKHWAYYTVQDVR